MYGNLASSRRKTLLQQLGFEDRLEYLDLLYLAASSLVDDAPASKISKQMQTESDGTNDQQQQNGIIYNQKSSTSW
jgi:hypothetical protein